MTPQERDLITSLLARLQQAGSQPKDREADALIRDGMARLPDAPYLLVQTVLIQDMALAEAQRRIHELEQQQQAEPAAPASFLAGARGSVPSAGSAGPWGRAAPPPQGAPSGPVWTQSGQPAAAPGAQAQPAAPPTAMAPLAVPGASSGFLRQAATTAAGIAGGALLFQGISSLFGPHYGAGFAGLTPQPGLGETVVNNYYNTDPSSAGTSQADYDPGVVQADNLDDTQDYASDQDSGGDWGSDGGSTDV